MKIGVIGDDFTGSSDIGNMLAREGFRTALFPGQPDGAGRRLAGMIERTGAVSSR